MSASNTYDTISELMERSFSAIATPDLTFTNLKSGTITVTLTIIQIVGPLLFALFIVGVIVNIGQVGFLLSPEALKPDFTRVNPINGFKRLFSERGIIELVKSLLKITVIGYVVFITIRDNYDLIFKITQMTLTDGLNSLFNIGYNVGMRVAMTLVFIAAVDFIFQRRAFNKSLKMSKQEIREEMKSNENPQLKSRIRARQQQLAMNRMMSAIPEADVVITNPTHLAVALQYKRGEGLNAPKVVAKGQLLIAERIKAKAQECSIPLMENKPLAQALFHSVEIGQTIPVDLYQAVAEVLAFVYRMKH
jgi:flagellar biosynthesis protein FlhB